MLKSCCRWFQVILWPQVMLPVGSDVRDPDPKAPKAPKVRNQSPLLWHRTPMKFDKFDFNKFEFEFAVGSSYALKTKQSTESRSSSLLRAQSFNSRSLAVAVCHCGQRGHHSFAHQAALGPVGKQRSPALLSNRAKICQIQVDPLQICNVLRFKSSSGPMLHVT
jgi:hypothetical protein